jgi:Flp pilus assembly pilin Flp
MRSNTNPTSHRIRSAVLAWWHDEEGVTSIEYGLMGALILSVCVLALTTFSDSLAVIYQKWADAVLAALP